MRSAALAAVLLAAAAGSAPRARPPAPPAAGDGGGLRVRASRPAILLQAGLDPLLHGSRSGRALLGCGLFRLDRRGRPRPDLARRAVSLDGGAAWEVELRDGLVLAGGEALDAVALVRLWHDQVGALSEAAWLTAPLSRPPLAVARLRVRFELSRPEAALPARLAHPWLALVEPAAEGREASSLGPFRPRRLQVGGGETAALLLTARSDHDHGSVAPVDLAAGPWPGLEMERRCAIGSAPYEMIFGPGERVPAEVRRRAAAGLAAPPAAAGPAPAALTTLEVLVPADDPAAGSLAADAQARLLDRGLRLRVSELPAAELERRLRAGRYQVAVIPLIPGLGDPVLDVEARLAATGLRDGAAARDLEGARAEASGRRRQRAADDLLGRLREQNRHLLLAREDVCLETAAGDMAPALAWLTRLPVRAFRPAPDR